MKPNRTLHLILLLVLMSGLFPACKKDDRYHRTPNERSSLNGIWASEGYGYLLVIKNGKADFYHTTKDNGITSPIFFDGASPDVATWDVAMDEKGKEFVYWSKNLVTNFRFRRLPKLPKILEAGGQAPTDDPQTNFDLLWQTFEEHYAFFQQRGVDWKAVRDTWRPRLNANNLETVVKEVLGLLNEDHVTLTTTTDDFLNRFDAGIFRTLSHFARELPAGASQTDLKLYAIGEYEKIVGNILSNYLSGVQLALDNQMAWGSLDERTGYLMIGQMQGYELADLRTALDAAIPELNKYQQLVIDLRGNLGGSDRVVLELAGRFTTKPMVGWRFQARDGHKETPLQNIMVQPTGGEQFTKPIRILTSGATASAAEVFTLVLKQLPGVKTVGEATNGIFSTILNKKMPNGWTFSLSNEVLQDAQGRVYEGNGIPADIPALFPAATHRNKGIDPALEQFKTWF